MLHLSISRAGTVLNGIYPNQFGPANDQLPATPFQAYQNDKLLIGYSESFSLRAFFNNNLPQSCKVLINEMPIADTSVLSKTAPHITAENGVLTYDGSAVNTGISLGNLNGKPLADAGVFAITDFLNCIPNANNFSASFVLTTYDQVLCRNMFQFSVLGTTVDRYAWDGTQWVFRGGYNIGRPFIATDVVAWRVTPEKFELLMNGVSVYEKARTWTLTLSNPDAGVLSVAGPYNFGQTVDFTTGTTAGTYTLTTSNQDGAIYKVEQPIEILTQAAPVPAPTVTTQDLILPVLAATLVNNPSLMAETATNPIGVADATDWRKIGTWGGIGLAVILAVVGIYAAIKK